MHTVSIITAVHAPGAAYLSDAVESVAAQELPPGWNLEWLVQEDGAAPGLASRVERHEFIRYAANGAQLGIGTTRNLALARATGTLVRVLDADDVLLAGALDGLIPHFADTDIHWAVGQADDLMPNGRRVTWDSALPYGKIPPGDVNRYAVEHEGNWPIHGAGLMIRTASLRALGGWAGMPNDEDLVMFAALSEITAGYNDPATTWLYRHHANQVTKTPQVAALSKNSRTAALQRVAAVRALALTMGKDSPGLSLDSLPGVGIVVGPAEKENNTKGR